MPRSLTFLAACLLALLIGAPGRAQDAPSPSLGDLARQAQKDKQKDNANKPEAKVITNDDVPSGSRGGGSGRFVQPGSAGQMGEVSSPAEGLEKLQSAVDKLDSLDRATLVSNVLGDNNSNFPGRAKWEEKLFAAKQSLVSENRVVLQKAQQLEATAEGMKDVQDPNDPRVKSFIAKLQQLVQESQQNSAAFQAVIAEGRDLAAQQQQPH